MVTLRVAMHCHGCARRVEKHISKMDGNNACYFFLISSAFHSFNLSLALSLYMNKMKIEVQLSYQYPLTLKFLYFASPEKGEKNPLDEP